MKKKLFILLFCVASLISVFGFASAMTESEKQILINQIMAQIAVLQEELNRKLAERGASTSGSGGSTQWCYTFNVNLRYGDSGLEVSALQKALESQGLFSANSSEKINSFFGSATTASVIRFQEKYKSEILTPLGLNLGTGTVASATRKKLNALYACTSYTQNTSTTNPSSSYDIACYEAWRCSNWGNCIDGVQLRSCIDYNKCKTTYTKTETQYCSANSITNNNSSSTSTSNSSSNYTYNPYDTSSTDFLNSVCLNNWQCTAYGACINGQKTKTCFDYAYCGNNNGRPTDEVMPCTIASNSGSTDSGSSSTTTCTERWNCGDWSLCESSLQQTRTCTDSGTCNLSPRTETQSCVCKPYFTCDNWSSCNNITKTKTRTCYDQNYCNYNNDALTRYGFTKPEESTECCDSEWQCEWGYCSDDIRYASCVDLNSCPIPTNMPSTTQSCISPKIDIKINNSDGPITIPVNSTLPLNITWYSNDNAYSCIASGNWDGYKDPSGSVYISSFSGPLAVGEYYYSINCRSSAGFIEDSVQLNIVEPNVIIKANDVIRSTKIYSGNSVAISWSATNAKANSCTFSGDWSGTGKPTSGSQTVGPLTSSKKYTITCLDELGNSKSASVDVIVKKFVDIKANNSDGPLNLSIGDSVDITWIIEEGVISDCRSSGDWFLFSGTEYRMKLTEAKTYNFSITCINSAWQEVTDTVVVNTSYPPTVF